MEMKFRIEQKRLNNDEVNEEAEQNFETAIANLHIAITKAPRRSQMAVYRHAWDIVHHWEDKHEPTATKFKALNFEHKTIESVNGKLKWENKQWSFGAFNDILPELTPDGYNYDMFLAHGAFGRASKVSLKNGRIFILKDVNMNAMDTEADKEKALREYRIHHALVHGNITRFETKGTLIDIPNGRIQMVQEYATNGTLDDVIKTF